MAKTSMDEFLKDSFKEYFTRWVNENGAKCELISFGTGYNKEVNKIVLQFTALTHFFIPVNEFQTAIDHLKDLGIVK